MRPSRDAIKHDTLHLIMIRILITILLLAIQFAAWWFFIIQPGHLTAEFTNIDLYEFLNGLPISPLSCTASITSNGLRFSRHGRFSSSSDWDR